VTFKKLKNVMNLQVLMTNSTLFSLTFNYSLILSLSLITPTIIPCWSSE